MKIGDIIRCVKIDSGMRGLAEEGLIIPVVSRNYTVRDLYRDPVAGDCVLLEEIVNKKHPLVALGKLECCFDPECFRVIEFPPALTESIQECLTRELEVVK